MPFATCSSHRSNRSVAEHEKKGWFHSVDLRHLANRRVVNNSADFLLAIGTPIVINGFKLNSMLARSKFPNSRVSFGGVSLLTSILRFVRDSLSPQRACR